MLDRFVIDSRRCGRPGPNLIENFSPIFSRLFFLYFRIFHNAKTKYSTILTINDKSVDGNRGTQTWGGRKEDTDESTEHKFTIQLMFKLSDWLKILNYIPNFLTNR